MTSVVGVADVWEGCEGVRRRFREVHRLFYSLDEHEEGRLPKVTVKEGGHHSDVLAPLLRCMVEAPRDTSGSVKLFALPAVEHQSLVKQVEFSC